jgi:uncharacterized membrane protein required for colicin V production
MSFLGGFSWLDALILSLLIAGLVVGYAQGLLRQIVGLAALYVGAILGAQYYGLIAGAIRYVFANAPVHFVNALAFFIIVLGVTTLIEWLVFDAYRMTKLQFMPAVDHIGGSLLCLTTTVVAVSMCLPVIAFAVGESWPFGEPTRFLLMTGMQTSRLVPIFDFLKPGLLNALGPWLPGGLPAIFNL